MSVKCDKVVCQVALICLLICLKEWGTITTFFIQVSPFGSTFRSALSLVFNGFKSCSLMSNLEAIRFNDNGLCGYNSNLKRPYARRRSLHYAGQMVSKKILLE